MRVKCTLDEATRMTMSDSFQSRSEFSGGTAEVSSKLQRLKLFPPCAGRVQTRGMQRDDRHGWSEWRLPVA